MAITLFVKNPEAAEHGLIYLHDIGDYLTREQKLETISAFNSTNVINEAQRLATNHARCPQRLAEPT